MKFTATNQPAGRGRKPKSEQYAGAIRRAEKKIADQLPTLVERMLELANGVLAERVEITAEGMEMRVYREAPDYKAISYLVDRIMGKPSQAIDMDVSGTGVVLVKALVGDDLALLELPPGGGA